MRQEQKNTIILLIGIVIIIAIPIIVNYVLKMPSPFNTRVVGNPTDWLAFFGAYLGGIVTASFGLVTLYINQRNYERSVERENEKELVHYRENQAMMLQDELIRRIESLNFQSIGRILYRFPNNVSKEEVVKEIDCLKERLEQVELQGIDWGIMSWHDLKSKPKNFDEKYLSQIMQYKGDVQAVISLLDTFLTEGADKIVLDCVKNVSKQIETHAFIITSLLAKPAKDWIEEEMGV